MQQHCTLEPVQDVLTCWDDDPPLVGGHVGGRGVFLVHVAPIVHLRCVVTPHQLIAFAHAAVHWRLPARAAQTASKNNNLWLIPHFNFKILGVHTKML